MPFYIHKKLPTTVDFIVSIYKIIYCRSVKIPWGQFSWIAYFLRLIGMSLHGFAFICYFKKFVFQRMIVLE